ncbi:MAG: hypothetical protein LC130_14180 [Bryobacterales bacterium]|nr:hypothetical protein [Bryobacterales bacterium]
MITCKGRIERILREGELLGLVFTVLLLIVIEACFVYWLNHLHLPTRTWSQPGLLVLPPWYQEPRFEVTLLLTIAAGTLFSVPRGLWRLWRSDNRYSAADTRRLRRRVNTAATVTVLAGLQLALVTWLR